MRTVLIVLIAFVCNITAFAQKSYDDIIGECYQIDVKGGKVYLSGGNEDEYEVRTIKQIVSLMKKDVFGYFGLNQKYSTPLQKSAFSKTEEYSYSTPHLSDHRISFLSLVRYHCKPLFVPGTGSVKADL